MSKTWEQLEIGDLIEIKIGPGTQRGFVERIPSSDTVRARMWSVRKQAFFKQSKSVHKSKFIAAIKECKV